MKKLIYSTYIEKGYGYVVDKKFHDVGVVLHNHDFFEIELIVDAKNAFHILNGKKRVIEKGSVYIINPSDIHCYEVGEKGYFDRYNIRFKQDTVSENILASVINTHCRCTLKDGDFETAVKLYEIAEHYYSDGSNVNNTTSEIISSDISFLKFL